MNVFEQQIHPLVAQLNPYLPAKSSQAIKDQYQLSTVIKLAGNENAWGCSPKVLEQIKMTTLDDITVYPNTQLHPVFHNLADFLQIHPDYVLLANGSDAIFSLLIQAFALPEKHAIVTHEFAFMGYEIQAHSFGIPCHKTSVHPESWQINIDHFLKFNCNQIAMIFIANPNNPTGNVLDWDEIQYLLKKIASNVIVVIDEAYFEYNTLPHPPLQQLLKQFSNLIITRTFSKAYGLASLRLGYAMGNPQILDILKKIQLPFTLNQIAMNLGCIAIDDQDFILTSVRNTHEQQQVLIQKLQPFPITIHPSYGNFITIDCHHDSKPLVTHLESKGIIIRPLHAFGLSNCARITVGQPQQNQTLIQTMQQYFH